MKIKVLLISFFLLAFSSGGIVMADGGSKSGQSSNSGSMQGMDMSSGSSSNSMPGMDMSGSSSSSNSMPGMDMSGSSNSNSMPGMDMNGSSSNSMPGMDMGGDQPVKETPANVKVLGTFGAVNLFFILIGIWNKWFRRKGDSIVNSK